MVLSAPCPPYLPSFRRGRPRHGLLLVGIASALLLAAGPVAAEDAADDAARIQDGSMVEIEYTMKAEDGTVIGSSTEGKNMVYEQGARQVPPGLEGALAGLATGDEKSVTLTPEEGFGAVDPSLFHTVPVEQVPEEGRRAGVQLMARDPQGNPHLMRVHEVKDDGIVLDMNHPLAGQTLSFDVKVVSIDQKQRQTSPHASPAP